jgi:hypothetical protein
MSGINKTYHFVKFRYSSLGIAGLGIRRDVQIRLQETYSNELKTGLPTMDLKAASSGNSSTDKLVRFGMALCFLVTGATLLATLASSGAVNRQVNMHLAGPTFPN